MVAINMVDTSVLEAIETFLLEEFWMRDDYLDLR